MHFCVVLAAIVAAVQALPLTEVEEQQWKEFALKFEKRYENEEEESRRRDIFAENLRTFAEHNKKYEAGLVSYTLGVNQFTDMTDEEFSKTLPPMNISQIPAGVPFVFPSNMKAPDSIDWRQQGLVTPVKDQQTCGSCYAFSAVGSLESQLAKKTGKLVALSEQNLVDCTTRSGNHGCDGGVPHICFDYVKTNPGINPMQSYPYENKAGACRFDPKNSAGTISGFTLLPKGDENALVNAVGTVGPVSILMHNADALKNYQSGILDHVCNPGPKNHAVVAVGYTRDYWIVKNSWAATWGEQGYFKLARNKNHCGIANQASYPLV